MTVSIINPQLINDETLERLLASLPSWRREAAMRYKFRQGRLENALSYHLLSRQLGYQPSFTILEHGKPILDVAEAEEKGLEKRHFNFSHCKNAVACALGKGPIGIDVECLGRYNDSLAKFTMSKKEVKAINEAEDPDAMFTILWTRKEALLKLTGEGITDDLKTVLRSRRMNGITIQSGYDKEQKYAWSVAYTSIDGDELVTFDRVVSV